ncbi:MAG: hypothetical protein MUC85_02320 [Anaerolineales bacterium]|jgi:hypothetical protein|nr:hypothetical protein [Anaerolineales bacterium]
MGNKTCFRVTASLLWLMCLAVVPCQQSVEAAPGVAAIASTTPSPTGVPVSIISPQSGQAIQGLVPVMVNTMVEGFLSAELYFSYAGDSTGTWFLISQQDVAMSEAPIATWDTSTITDGNYILRLVVTAREREPIIFLVEGLRVRNYSPVETDTPTPSATLPPADLPTHTPAPTLTLTPIPLTSTPLPTNPAVVSVEQFGLSAGAGGLAAIVGIGALGFYLSIQQRRRRR